MHILDVKNNLSKEFFLSNNAFGKQASSKQKAFD